MTRTASKLPQLCSDVPGAPRTETGLYFIHGTPFEPRDLLEVDPDDFALTQVRPRPPVADALETFDEVYEMDDDTAVVDMPIGGVW